MPVGTKFLIAIFFISGSFHLITPEVFLPLMPPVLPEPILLIYLSGIAELVCAVGLAMRLFWAPWATVAVLLAVWPGNWWFAIDSISSRELWVSVLAWLRLPLQIPLFYFALKSPIKKKSSYKTRF